jgi:hypothetical protein
MQELEFVKSLKESAWYDGRKVDISHVADDLKREGLYPLNDKVSAFLEEYHYVTLDSPKGFSIQINVDDSLQGVSISLLEKIKSLLNDFVVPIGLIHCGYNALLMTYAGSFYTVIENELIFLGNDLPSLFGTISASIKA